MALSPGELQQIEDRLGRKPSKVEEHIIDTMWSEHCSYKSSRSVLKTLPTEGSDVVLGVGEDSGIIHFTEHHGHRYGIALSHESHNHPSQVLPVEGAATGVGGVVRDVYCMGADVIGVLDSLHFGKGDPKDDKVAFSNEIAEEVVQGVSDYGNALGVPVLGGETIYHPSYTENCLVNVAAVGLVREDQIIRSRVPEEAKHEPYDVILIGKTTDSTGFGGATFSSDVLDQDDQAANMGAVQVHDPFLKRVIVEGIKALLKRVHQKKVPIGFKDLGAGGIACVSTELADAGGFGMELNLDWVNTITDDLPSEVIACSETQERFCVAVPSHFTNDVLNIFNNIYKLPELYHKAGAVVVGKILQEPTYRIVHRGETVCDMPITFITEPIRLDRPSKSRDIVRETPADFVQSIDKIEETCLKISSDDLVTSKRYIYRFYDNAVKGHTVIYPGEADAVVTTPVHGSFTGLSVSIDSNVYGNVDPYVSGAYAVAEAVRNVVAVGGAPIALTDCLNYGSPEQPSVFFDFKEGVRGIGDAARQLGFLDQGTIPIISGNVSFYNESKSGKAVVPSPVILAVGRLPDFRKALTMHLQAEPSQLVLIGKRFPEFGGTVLSSYLGEMFSEQSKVAPQVRFSDELAQNRAIYSMIQSDHIVSCHDIAAGGLWQTLVEMVLGERGRYRCGVHLDLPEVVSPWTSLFSENGGFVVQVTPDQMPSVKEICYQFKLDWHVLGDVQLGKETPKMTLNYQNKPLVNLSAEDLKTAWNRGNLEHFGTRI